MPLTEHPVRLRRLARLFACAPLVVLVGVALSPGAFAQPAKPSPPTPTATPLPSGKPPIRILPALPPQKPAPPTGRKDGGPPGAPKPGTAAKASTRWTEATPERMAALGVERARAGGSDALAGLLVAASLDTRVVPGQVGRTIAAIAGTDAPVADDARLVAMELAPPPPSKPWQGWAKANFDAPPDASGIVHTVAILGPFQDTGGGVKRHEGPEAEGQTFTDAKATYSWGVYEVGWERSLPDTAMAEGIPLDLYISPRQEVCTYLATKVTLADNAGPIVVHVAATGSLRLSWDGATIGTDEDVYQRAIVDRMAAKIEPETGAHLLSLKVCSGTQGDDGRVRIRFTDAANKGVAFNASSDLSGIPDERARSNDPPDAATTSAKPAKPAGPAKKAPPSRGKVERVKTPLEIALDVGAAPSKEQALEAAVVRTLGGADDLRSPRAPGLLDRASRATLRRPRTSSRSRAGFRASARTEADG